MCLQRDADAEEQFPGARFGGIAVEFAEADFQLGGPHVVLFAGFRVGVDPVFLLLDRPQFRVAHHHHVQHHLVLVGELVLAQLAQALAGVDGNVAGGGL